MKLLKFVPDDTHIGFMRYSRAAVVASIVAALASIALFFVVGLNYGIDFRGGTLIELQSRGGAADVGEIRSELSALDLGDVQVQEFGAPEEVLIRLEEQPGGDAAQQEALRRVQGALTTDDYVYRRVEVVGPQVSSELARSGFIAVAAAFAGVLIYIWFRFEWQFAIGAVLATLHDVLLTVGLFAIVQLEFNLSSIAAVLTILGYSLNDTVVVYDRIRENLRKYKRKPLPDIIDRSINDMLSRTILTSVTTLIALLSLYFLGGEVIASFTFAMIWGVIVGTYSSVFIAAPILMYFNLRASQVAPPEGDAATV